MKFLSQISVFFLLTILVAGCGQKADSQKPIEEVRAEAQTMSVAQLEQKAKAYADEIASKRSEADKIKSELSSLKPTELMSEKAKDIKDRAGEVAKEVSALTQRYEIYVSQLKKAGGDISKVQI